MAKAKRRKKKRSKRSNPAPKTTHRKKRRKARRNPSSASPRKHHRKVRRKARRNPAHTKWGKVRAHRRRVKNPESVIKDLVISGVAGLAAMGAVGVGTFLVAQKLSKGTNVVPATTLRNVQIGVTLAGLGAAYLLATHGKQPIAALGVAGGALAGGFGPAIVQAGVKAIATQQAPAQASASQPTTNGLGRLVDPRMGRLTDGLGQIVEAAPHMGSIFDQRGEF